MSRRRALQLFGGVGAGTALASGCTFTKGTAPIATQGLSKKPAPGRKVNLEMYSLWGAATGQGLITLAKKYESIQDDVGIRVTFAPTTGNGEQQKLLVSIAASIPPDIALLIPYQTPQWSELGIMTDLTPYLKAANLGEKDFVKPAWHDMNYNGKTWQLQWDVDPNFPFFWNKDLFEKAGLDPDRPPKTIEEVDEYSKQLLKKSGRTITQVGMIPWGTPAYGFANAIFTWGFCFGGKFYDAEKDELTPDDEFVVKALEWIVRYAKSVGGADAVPTVPPSLALHQFGAENLAMSPLVSANLRDIKAAKPDMKIGAGLLPYQTPGATAPGQGAWIGGWSAFIPAKSKHPVEAWDFLRFMSADPVGTNTQWKEVGFVPAYLKSPALADVKKDPIMAPYYDTMFATSNSRPSMPISDFLAQQFETYVSKAVYGQMSALAAMRAVKQNVDKEYARFKREVSS